MNSDFVIRELTENYVNHGNKYTSLLDRSKS